MESNNLYLEEICYRSLWLFATSISRMFFNFKIIGKENLPKESAILVANHCTPMDGFLVSSMIFNQIHFFIQYEGIYYTRVGKFLKYSGEIFVKVKEANMGAMKKSRYVLTKTNDYIGIFPEGPMKDMGKLETPYGGAAYLSKLTGKDIIPIGIFVPEEQRQFLEEKGNFHDFKPLDLLKKHYKINKLGKTLYVINVGKSRNISEIRTGNTKQKIIELTDILQDDSQRLSEKTRIAYENNQLYI